MHGGPFPARPLRGTRGWLSGSIHVGVRVDACRHRRSLPAANRSFVDLFLRVCPFGIMAVECALANRPAADCDRYHLAMSESSSKERPLSRHPRFAATILSAARLRPGARRVFRLLVPAGARPGRRDEIGLAAARLARGARLRVGPRPPDRPTSRGRSKTSPKRSCGISPGCSSGGIPARRSTSCRRRPSPASSRGRCLSSTTRISSATSRRVGSPSRRSRRPRWPPPWSVTTQQQSGGVFTFGGTGTLLYGVKVGLEKACPGTVHSGIREPAVDPLFRTGPLRLPDGRQLARTGRRERDPGPDDEPTTNCVPACSNRTRGPR